MFLGPRFVRFGDFCDLCRVFNGAFLGGVFVGFLLGSNI